VCGLADDLCPGCRATAQPEALDPDTLAREQAAARWRDLQNRYPWLRSCGGLTYERPEPLATEDLSRLVGSLLDPCHGPALGELLLKVLAPGIAAICAGAVEEARRR
jgi:hypothetical protein